MGADLTRKLLVLNETIWAKPERSLTLNLRLQGTDSSSTGCTTSLAGVPFSWRSNAA